METILRKSPKASLYVILEQRLLDEAERARFLYVSRQKMEWDILSRERGARDEDQKERNIEIAQSLLKIGISAEDSANITGLTLEDIDGLQKAR